MQVNPLIERIEHIITPAVESLGYQLVLVRMHGEGGGASTLQVLAERRDEQHMTVDDCTRISRTISSLLDIEDPIRGSYQLEVSSPGIDRPLVKLADFERFKGWEAKLETWQPIETRKRFKGKIAGVEGEEVLMETSSEEIRISFNNIHNAKLVLTDELVRQHLRAHKKH